MVAWCQSCRSIYTTEMGKYHRSGCNCHWFWELVSSTPLLMPSVPPLIWSQSFNTGRCFIMCPCMSLYRRDRIIKSFVSAAPPWYLENSKSSPVSINVVHFIFLGVLFLSKFSDDIQLVEIKSCQWPVVIHSFIHLFIYHLFLYHLFIPRNIYYVSGTNSKGRSLLINTPEEISAHRELTF